MNPNQMLEDYVIEARQLREQVGILLRLLTVVLVEGPYEYPLEEVTTAEPMPVRIEDGTVHVG